MSKRNGFKFAPALAVLGCAASNVLANGCSLANSLASAAKGCDDFPSNVSALSIDANTKAFVQAAADLQAVSNSMESSVLASCIGIASDLGATDTWTAQAPSTTDGSIDAEVTAACNAASTAITAALNAAADGGTSATVQCGLNISGGQCTVSASAEATCEGTCSGSTSCTPPDITASCSPGDISGQCSGSCKAGATCEGSVSAPVVSCTGTCSAQCSGECDVVPGTVAQVQCQGNCAGACDGTCTGTMDGTTCTGTCNGTCTGNCTYSGGSPPAVHCAGTCTGSCNGNCVVAGGGAMVSCGASVNCKGLHRRVHGSAVRGEHHASVVQRERELPGELPRSRQRDRQLHASAGESAVRRKRDVARRSPRS